MGKLRINPRENFYRHIHCCEQLSYPLLDLLNFSNHVFLQKASGGELIEKQLDV